MDATLCMWRIAANLLHAYGTALCMQTAPSSMCSCIYMQWAVGECAHFLISKRLPLLGPLAALVLGPASSLPAAALSTSISLSDMLQHSVVRQEARLRALSRTLRRQACRVMHLWMHAWLHAAATDQHGRELWYDASQGWVSGRKQELESLPRDCLPSTLAGPVGAPAWCNAFTRCINAEHEREPTCCGASLG